MNQLNNMIDTTFPEIENGFEQLFDFFRSTRLKKEQYYVALYLLFIQYKKINLTEIQFDNNNSALLQIHLTDLISNNIPIGENELFAINNAFIPALQTLGKSGVNESMEILSRIDFDVLMDNFSEIFDSLLYRLSNSQGRISGEFIMPIEISRFMCSLVDLKEEELVYNPFAGLASFAVLLDQECYYTGQEMNEYIWSIGFLRILAYDNEANSRFISYKVIGEKLADKFGNLEFLKSDSLQNWIPTNHRLSHHLRSNDGIKFDLVISEPPFGKMPSISNGQFGSIKTYEHFLIENGTEALNPNGRLVACISKGFLYNSGSEYNLRNYLIDYDMLEMVISLPEGMLMNTGVATTIIVINKNKKEKGKVCFVDAKKFVETSSTQLKKLNDYKLNSAIKISNDSDTIRFVSNETIAINDFNLNVPLYFQKEFDGVKFGNIGTIIRGRRIAEGQKGKFVRIRDLKDDKLDFKLSVEQMDDVTLPRLVQCIEESCIIVALRWKTLKPTLFNYSGVPIFLTTDTLAFKVDETKVDPAFLIYELNAEYVIEQLNAYRIGETIPAIRREDLLNVKINLPSIEEQRAKVTGILEISSKINQLQAERNALAHGLGQKQFNEFASLKHTLGTPRQNILSYAEALIRFFEKNPSPESEKLSADFKERMGVDLNSAFQAIKQDINFISELLEKGENGLQLSDYNLELINLHDLEKLISKVKIDVYNFPLIIQPLKIYNKDEQGVNCNSTLLKIMLDNILINAQKHGFDSKKQSHEVVIDLSVLDDNLIIDIKNNGKKFPKGFDKEKFIAKYSTANPNNGTGIGGYDINRIIDHFNGTWDLILNDDTIYPVRFRIQFPIKPMI